MRGSRFSFGALALATLTAACGDGGSPSTDTQDMPDTSGSGGTASPTGGGAAPGAGGNSGAGAGAGGSRQGAGGGQGGAAATGGGGGMASASDAGGPGGNSCKPTTGGDGGATGTVGVWEDVTPADANVATTSNGAEMVLVDPARPSDVYVGINSRGVWKSTDYGQTWHKANTGTNGDKVSTGGFPYGAIDLDPCRNPATPPAIYVTQLFGSGGFWIGGYEGKLDDEVRKAVAV